MPTKPGGDHNAAPTNSTFTSRAAERAGKPKPPRRRTTLRAGIDAETDFTITTSRQRGDSVRPIR